VVVTKSTNRIVGQTHASIVLKLHAEHCWTESLRTNPNGTPKDIMKLHMEMVVVFVEIARVVKWLLNMCLAILDLVEHVTPTSTNVHAITQRSNTVAMEWKRKNEEETQETQEEEYGEDCEKSICHIHVPYEIM
jgi:hypothetical protein